MAEIRTAAQRVLDAYERLARESDVWLATSSESRPWLVPLWFLWHDNKIFLATSPASMTAKNIASHAAVRLAFQSTEDVLVLDGSAEIHRAGDVSDDMFASYTAKYAGSDPRTWDDAVIVTVTPDRVQAWRNEDEIPGRVIMRRGQWVTDPQTLKRNSTTSPSRMT
jgi:general stress protein 26